MTDKQRSTGSSDGIFKNKRPKGMTDEESESLLSLDIRGEFNSISLELEKFHGLFCQLWEMGIPRLTWDVPTAAVYFDREGRNVEFAFNPLLWKNSDRYTKCFIICHEVLHVMLSHGLRTKDCQQKEVANKALDVVVNHMLISKFGYDRNSVNIGMYPEGHEKAGQKIELCWIDNVFPGMENIIEREKPFEYYYRMLEQNSKMLPNGKMMVRKGGEKGQGSKGESGEGDGEGQGQGSGDGWEEVTGEALDDHSGLGDFDDERAKDEIAETINNQLDDDEKQEISETIHESEDGNAAQKAEESAKKDGTYPSDTPSKRAGSVAGKICYQANVKRRVKTKRKWEAVIKKWSRKYKDKDKEEEQWTRRARRYSMVSPNIMLPTQMDIEHKSETRIKVRFYQDTSGSCMGFRDRFFAAAKSLPIDRFDIELFCFDTKVYAASIEEGKLYGFGGTSFDILENHVQQQLKSGEISRHPEAVFVITDGWGNSIKPAKPDKWHFFLSENNRSCIPEECNIYDLKEYE